MTACLYVITKPHSDGIQSILELDVDGNLRDVTRSVTSELRGYKHTISGLRSFLRDHRPMYIVKEVL